MTTFGQEQILEEGEVISERVRKHWIVYVKDFMLHAFGCLFFLLVVFVLQMESVFGSQFSIETSSGSLLLLAWVLLFWTSFFYSWTKDYFDVWYVTNEHIIAINQKHILHREEAFMELSKIQDVSFEKEGLLSTFLDYGNLKVQSAGIEQEFIMEDVHDIERVAKIIMELRDAAQTKKEEGAVIA